MALDSNGRPKPVAQITPETEDEQKKYDSAIRRRELRLVLAGRMKPEDAKELQLFFGAMKSTS